MFVARWLDKVRVGDFFSRQAAHYTQQDVPTDADTEYIPTALDNGSYIH